ncbi:hypothetical protein [Oceanobacillus sp. FSL K6-0251]|uniref:hypothetical protein n=1 Tax=Oceanobacillus sp. FSL K6-0251 TaxID=2921602 RepID=UPI0030FA7813
MVHILLPDEDESVLKYLGIEKEQLLEQSFYLLIEKKHLISIISYHFPDWSALLEMGFDRESYDNVYSISLEDSPLAMSDSSVSPLSQPFKKRFLYDFNLSSLKNFKEYHNGTLKEQIQKQINGDDKLYNMWKEEDSIINQEMDDYFNSQEYKRRFQDI